MKNVIVWLCLLFAFGSCVHNYKLIETDRRFDVIAVYYHEQNRYSVAFMKNGEYETTSLYGYDSVKVLPDVPPLDSMYVETHSICDNYRLCGHDGSWTRIHIHKPSEINTAGWNHGKFGNGTTTILEREK